MFGDEAITLPGRLAHALGSTFADVHARWQDEALAAALKACYPWRWLSREEPFIGFHVLCMLHKENSATRAADPPGAAPGKGMGQVPDALALFAEGRWSEQPSALLPWGAAADLTELTLLIQHALGLPRRAVSSARQRHPSDTAVTHAPCS